MARALSLAMPDAPTLTDGLQRAGDVIVGRYTIGELIGYGGMGAVYAAVQQSLARKVAVKLPLPALRTDPHVRARFRAEALAGARVRHRNVVRVLDFGDDGGVPFLVLEHVPGVGLGQLLAERGPMPIATASAIVGEILGGLAEIHAAGIVHADLKSDNVLIETLRDGAHLPRIMDFGLARFAGEPTAEMPPTQPVVSGTPEYLAPELVRGLAPSVASDIYAVGVILYELISGVTPFDAATSAEVMARQVDDLAVPLSWRCAADRVSSDLDDVLARALAKAPADRFASAYAFQLALADAVSLDADGRDAAEDDDAGGFATDTPTVVIPRRTRPIAAGTLQPFEARGRELAAAEARGDLDAIVVGYLDMARARVDAHELPRAIADLEARRRARRVALDAVSIAVAPSSHARRAPRRQRQPRRRSTRGDRRPWRGHANRLDRRLRARESSARSPPHRRRFIAPLGDVSTANPRARDADYEARSPPSTSSRRRRRSTGLTMWKSKPASKARLRSACWP